ncbi:MAG: molybdenum ABC transporter ATP-binding protein [Pseudomonadota bacterium]
MKLSVSFRHRFGEADLDIAFEAGPGVTALFGRSGAGKTTSVNAVAGLFQPDEGRIALDKTTFLDTSKGIVLPAHRRRVGYVFQDARLFPHLSVRGNLGFGARFVPGPIDASMSGRVQDLLGLTPLLDRRPRDLSGGERQRVAIGRALLAQPRLLLLDEPLAALDAERKEQILPYLARLRKEMDFPILYVSHSVDEVARLAAHVVVIDAGRVARTGSPGAIFSDMSIAGTLGARTAGALITGKVLERHSDGLTSLTVSGGVLYLAGSDAVPGERVTVRIAAEDVLLSRLRPEGLSALNILPATILAVEDAGGPERLVQLQAGEDRLLARITARSAQVLELSPGTVCYAIVKSMALAMGGDPNPKLKSSIPS